MGVPICKYTNEKQNRNQNRLKSYTNYLVIDETNNHNKNRKRYCNKYFLNYKTSHLIRPHLGSQNENNDIIKINKGFTNSKNHSSPYLPNIDINKIFDKANNLSSKFERMKSKGIKNPDNDEKTFLNI